MSFLYSVFMNCLTCGLDTFRKSSEIEFDKSSVVQLLPRGMGHSGLPAGGARKRWGNSGDTPKNRAAAQKIWAVHANRSHLDGVTTFKTGDDSSREDALINELDTIDLHHGTHSADPPYTVLEVIGVVMSERLKTELSQFGFDEFEATAEGFRAVRPLPSDGVSR